jgi:hypothetical protein
MINIQASVSKAWLNETGGYKFPGRYYLDPLHRLEQDRKMNRLVADIFPGYAIYNMESNLVQAGYVKENQILVGAIQPNMLLAVLAGSDFLFFDDKDGDVTGKPFENITIKEDLPPPGSLTCHTVVKMFEEQITQIRQTHPGSRIIPPFFWDESGRATIHGIITTSLKLAGDNIMTAMMTDPGLVHAIHKWITDSYIILVSHFAELADMPVKSIHIGECAGTMLSAPLYEDFVIPYINQAGRMLGPVRLHTCGFSDHLLESISHIENLKIIDTGSDTSVAGIRAIMGKDFEIDVAPPASILMKGKPRSGVIDWLHKTISENRDGDLLISYHLEPEYDTNNVLAIHEELERMGLIINTRLY